LLLFYHNPNHHQCPLLLKIVIFFPKGVSNDMSGFTCPFCSNVMAINDLTKISRFPSFENEDGRL